MCGIRIFSAAKSILKALNQRVRTSGTLTGVTMEGDGLLSTSRASISVGTNTRPFPPMKALVATGLLLLLKTMSVASRRLKSDLSHRARSRPPPKVAITMSAATRSGAMTTRARQHHAAIAKTIIAVRTSTGIGRVGTTTAAKETWTLTAVAATAETVTIAMRGAGAGSGRSGWKGGTAVTAARATPAPITTGKIGVAARRRSSRRITETGQLRRSNRQKKSRKIDVISSKLLSVFEIAS